MAEDDALRDFLDRWLRAWTGNNPAGFMEFYADDAFYSDPALRAGIRGRDALLNYFSKLLAANPSWEWSLHEVLAFSGGCAVKWRALIPAGGETVMEEGLDIVEIREGKITRNEVYFDRTGLLRAMRRI